MGSHNKLLQLYEEMDGMGSCNNTYGPNKAFQRTRK